MGHQCVYISQHSNGYRAALNNHYISLWDTLVCDPPCHSGTVLSQIWSESENIAGSSGFFELVKWRWTAEAHVKSDAGLTIGDLVEAVLKECGEFQYGSYHYKITTAQDMISEFYELLQGSCGGIDPCMELYFSPDETCDDRLLPQSRVCIPLDETRATVAAIYATEGEPVGVLSRDQVEVWKPLVVSLNRQRYG
jgi:hypothetical protein